MLAFLSVIEDAVTRNKLEKLYYMYHKTMFYIAYSILKDYHEAEDIVQSAILKLSEHIDDIKDAESSKTQGFIMIIVKNMAINTYNQKKKISSLETEAFDHLFPLETPESLVLQLDLGEEIAEKLALINPVYADLLTLKYYFEYTTKELSELLNLTENNVRVKLYRARNALYDILGGEDFEKAYQV